MKNYKLLICSILTLFSSTSQSVDWPAATGTCSTTLQSCIDTTSAGSTIYINTNTTALFSATLFVHKELKLIAGIGYHPKFINVIVDVEVANDKAITIQGFDFEQASWIDADVASDSELNILNNNWHLPDSASGKKEGIKVLSNATVGLTTINIKRNVINGEGNNSSNGFVHVFHPAGGTVLVNINENQITDRAVFTNNSSVVQFINRVGTLGVQMVGNEIRGGLSQVAFSQLADGNMEVGVISNLLTGVIDENNSITSSASNKAIDSNIGIGQFYGNFANNTIDGVKRVSGADGVGFDFSGHTTNVSSIYYIFNNIVTNTAQAYLGPATGTNVSQTSGGNNIFHNHGTISGLSLLFSDLVADPLFKNEGVNYALKAGSFAIDKSSSIENHTDVHDSSVTMNAPNIDADGMRRYKGKFVDAGAYEWGDKHIFHESTNASFITNLTDSDLNNNSNAIPFITQIWNYGDSIGVYNDHPTGVYLFSNIWRVFNIDQAIFPSNSKFHVFYPYGEISDDLNGLDRRVNLAGTAQIAMDIPLLNNSPEKQVFVTNYWDSVYNPNSLEVGYSAVDNKWKIGNVNGVTMPTGTKYNIYHQDASRNVFRHIVSDNNVFFNNTVIDHPLLNNNPCALPTITQATVQFFGPVFEQNPFNIGVFYDTFEGRWAVFNQDGTSAILIDPIGGSPTAGGVFNVMVDPQQVYDCKLLLNDLIFSNGFEN